jgi:hypothetical protein
MDYLPLRVAKELLAISHAIVTPGQRLPRGLTFPFCRVSADYTNIEPLLFHFIFFWGVREVASFTLFCF